MRRYVGPAALVALALMLAVSQLQGQGAGKGKTDKDKLQGTWSVVSMEVAGEKAPDQVISGSKLTFTGDKVSFKFGPMQPEESTYTIDAGKSPKTIIINPPKGKEKEKAMQGIYTFDGDNTLKICGAEMGDPRPTDFTTKAGSKNVLITLKRDKK